MNRIILLFVLVFSQHIAFAQSPQDSTVKITNLLNSIEPYGTFEYAIGGNRRGWAIVDIIPRVGLKGEWKFDNNPKYYFFTKAEVGLNLTQRNDYVSINIDPGAPVGRTNNALFARQGFIGIGSPYGRFSIGKQWGVHYSLAGELDDMYMFGSDAIGVYNAATDGGVSGTGRADQSAKYELEKGKFYFGAQAQFRNLSVNSKTFIDTYGAAFAYDFKVAKIGVSYNKVLDGIISPTMGEAKIDDEMIAFFIDFKGDNYHFSIMSQLFNNHEIDNLGAFYKGWGVEYHFKYNFGKDKKWAFVNNSSIMMPFANVGSKFIMNMYAIELARRFSQNTVLIVGGRFDNSILVNGARKELLTVGVGFYYNFNYPVP